MSESVEQVPDAVLWARRVRAALLAGDAHKPGDRDLAWAIDPDAYAALVAGAGDEELVTAQVRRATALTHTVTFSWPAGLDIAPRHAVGPFPDVDLVVARLRALQDSGDPDFELPPELA